MPRSSAVVAMAAASGVAALFAAGCGGSDSDGQSASGGDAGKTVVIGFSQRRIAGSDWWKTLVKGVKDEAQREGAKVEVTDAGGDTVQQISDVKTLLTRGVDGLIINPNDPRGV